MTCSMGLEGNFNVVCFCDERRGGSRLSSSMKMFNAIINDQKFQLHNSSFTSRINGFFVSSNWIDYMGHKVESAMSNFFCKHYWKLGHKRVDRDHLALN